MMESMVCKVGEGIPLCRGSCVEGRVSRVVYRGL